MSTPGSLLIRNGEIGGARGLDVVISNGSIAAIGAELSGSAVGHVEQVLDAGGGAVIPGLIDHHIHMLGLAAAATSLVLDKIGPMSPAAFADRLADAAAEPGGGWLRVTGYDETMSEDLDRHVLDRIAPHSPIRVQHRTGAMWVFNSLALKILLSNAAPPPPGLEMQCGIATGRLHRGDDWLATRLPLKLPDLAAAGRDLARFGITGLTDASATTDAARALVLAEAHRSGALPQRLTLMSAGPLPPADDGAYAVGPVKLLLDDAVLPEFDAAMKRLADARAQGRSLAVHCVTAAELAFTLALFEAGGAAPGDRIEHGGVIHPGAADEIARLGLTVVTQPNFIFERGDRYIATVEARDVSALYPCGSLLSRGVRVAAGSDAPYASPDPWLAIGAATQRTTRGGQVLGEEERIGARRALGLYLGAAGDPGGPERQIIVGAPADLCLLSGPLASVLAGPGADAVQTTVIGGAVVYDRASRPGRSAKSSSGRQPSQGLIQGEETI